uniref:Zip family zinc transporter n=1 Tax=Exophiala pisciphila TaxID=86051 RepID=A0A0N9QX63_9EURO|nr:Zip family zinc transporter [Exophiala pisciphila]
MMLARILLLVALGSIVQAQTTYTGCHNHSTVEYCYGPDGVETAVYTYSSIAPTTLSTATLPASVSATATATGQTTAVTGCHSHNSQIYCINGAGEEVLVSSTATVTGEPPAQYTDCHAHGVEQWCMAPDGSEVLVVAESSNASESDGHSGESSSGGEQEMDCHFHAGVEHCVAAGGSESATEELNCGITERDYDIGLRIGTLFVILVTSGIGVFAPMVLTKLPSRSINASTFTIVKQFGTGVILSTAFIHLYTHATLMFNNQCLGSLEYEGTTSAIVMGGIILAFLFEYIGHRLILARGTPHEHERSAGSEETTTTAELAKEEGEDPTKNAVTGPPSAAYKSNNLTNLGHNHGNPLDPANPNSKLSVIVMEAGILFHSVLIGLTLVVAGDSFYKTLLVVIVFHQFFEGLALGARIALLPSKFARFWRTKFPMAVAFTLITPLGMAIGLGVINEFNGNERNTIVAIGTLDALSAGILIWVGVVDMLARDWLLDCGAMVHASIGRTLLGGVSLFAGMILMSVLGKWA